MMPSLLETKHEVNLALNGILLLCCNIIEHHTKISPLWASSRPRWCSASMDSSRELDKIESSVAHQITEPLVLLKFCLALPHTVLHSKAALCVSMLFSSCAVRNRVEVSQIHYTSAVVCCRADWCLRKMRYSQTQGTPCSKPGGGQLPLEEEKTAPLLLPCRRKNALLRLGGSCVGLGRSHQHLASGYPFPSS